MIVSMGIDLSARTSTKSLTRCAYANRLSFVRSLASCYGGLVGWCIRGRTRTETVASCAAASTRRWLAVDATGRQRGS